MTKITLEWVNAAGTRAIKTVAQTALGLFTVGSTLTEIDWVYILSVSIVAGIYSMLMSVVTELPEVGTDGILKINTTDSEVVTCSLGLDVCGDALLQKKVVKLKIIEDNSPS